MTKAEGVTSSRASLVRTVTMTPARSFKKTHKTRHSGSLRLKISNVLGGCSKVAANLSLSYGVKPKQTSKQWG